MTTSLTVDVVTTGIEHGDRSNRTNDVQRRCQTDAASTLVVDDDGVTLK